MEMNLDSLMQFAECGRGLSAPTEEAMYGRGASEAFPSRWLAPHFSRRGAEAPPTFCRKLHAS